MRGGEGRVREGKVGMGNRGENGDVGGIAPWLLGIEAHGNINLIFEY